MKKAKRILALALGILMVLGCVSVSASDALTVTEKPAKIIYENDFSGSTADTEHIVLGENTVQSDGVLIAKPAPAGAFATIYAAKEGITEPVYFEFDISNTGLTDIGNGQIQMSFLGNNDSLVGDVRWCNGNPMYFRMVSPNTSVAPHKDVAHPFYSAHIKVKMNPDTKSYAVWVNGEELLSEEDGVNYARNSFTLVKGFKVTMANGDIRDIKLDNLKIYTDEAASVPAIWEEISREDFENDMTTAQSHGKVNLYTSDATNTWANGVLTATSSNGSLAWDYSLTDDQGAPLTGEYVVEVKLSRGSVGSNRHRIFFNDTIYIGWNPSYNGIMVRHWNPNDSAQSQIGTNNEQFNATTNLKITALINTEKDTIKLWFNDIYAHEHTFDKGGLTSSANRVRLNPYGTVSVDDIRVYRPLETDSTTGLKIEEKDNEVKIATTAAKTGNLYFAKYDSDAETGKTLESLGVAPLDLKPGKIYTVDKSNWLGAKAFFWDNNLSPIVSPWILDQ